MAHCILDNSSIASIERLPLVKWAQILKGGDVFQDIQTSGPECLKFVQKVLTQGKVSDETF